MTSAGTPVQARDVITIIENSTRRVLPTSTKIKILEKS
jgi:hypothetical protein